MILGIYIKIEKNGDNLQKLADRPDLYEAWKPEIKCDYNKELIILNYNEATNDDVERFYSLYNTPTEIKPLTHDILTKMKVFQK